ncbi:hypothetical protein M1307_03005, partial [Patescibacteria group bacterium]|nr:hypothetical protein [Patescibacteria group bacterium]
AKRARKYFLGLTTATQDVEDFLSTDYGKAVLSNSSIQILLKQGTAEIDMIQKTFYLSEGEKELLLSANVGEGLFFAGRNHAAIGVVASNFEKSLVSSSPIEAIQKQEKEQLDKKEIPVSPIPNIPVESAPPQPFIPANSTPVIQTAVETKSPVNI